MEKRKILEKLREYADTMITIENIKSSFDVLMKRRKRSYFIKILKNVDSINKDESNSLLKISTFFNSEPFIIGEYSNNGLLEDYILFKRFSITVGTINTFLSYLENRKLPIKNASSYFKINGRKMRKLREDKGLSLNQLSKITGISKETLYRYEKGLIFAGVDNLKKLENFFDTELADIIEYKTESKKLVRLGEFKAVQTKNPFYYLLCDEESRYIVGKEKSRPDITIKYKRVYERIGNELESEYFFITKSKIDAPYVLNSEINKYGFSEKIKLLIKNRR